MDHFKQTIDADCLGGVRVIDRMRRATEQWNIIGHLDHYALALSVGGFQWKTDRTFLEGLKEADEEMYASKRARTT